MISLNFLKIKLKYKDQNQENKNKLISILNLLFKKVMNIKR